MTGKFLILFFLDLIQDLDPILPLVRAGLRRMDLSLRVVGTDRLFYRSPRVSHAFNALHVDFQVVKRPRVIMGLAPDLRNVDLLVTASESSARPHLASHRLTLRANALGIPTFTLQHGFEHHGLTYFDHRYPPASNRFASRRILIWGDQDGFPSKTPPGIRSRCVSVGCPKDNHPPPASFAKPRGFSFVVTVCENLHWYRYSETYRRLFLHDLTQAALTYDDTFFLVKPHHDELWLARHPNPVLSGMPNVMVIDPRDPQWEPYTAPALFPHSDAVITTPSTIAVDAAGVDLPVAVTGYGLDLEIYRPLPLLSSSEDWICFVEDTRDPAGRENLVSRSRLFFQRSLVPGDAVEKILNLCRDEMMRRRGRTCVLV